MPPCAHAGAARADVRQPAPRVTTSLAQIVGAYGPAYRAAHRISSAQHRVLRDVAYCRTAALGGHREQCANCGHSRVRYHSCRNRHCPQCQALPQAKWREAQRALLLPVPYFHVVFTLPHALNALIRSNARPLYALLFECVIATLREFAHDPRHLGAEPGMTAVLHTWGQKLDQHVHLHLIVTGGGLDAARQQWVTCKRPDFLFPVRPMSKMFRGKFLAGLCRLRQQGKLTFAGASAELTTDGAWRLLLAKLRALRWVVYAKPPFSGPESVLDYLSRYTHRIAISNERLLALDQDRVRFRYKDYAHGNAIKVMELPATEFLRRFLLHVVPRGFRRVRHYGLLANCRRAERLARCRELLAIAPPPPPPPADSLAEAVQRLMSVDITRCPRCGQAGMQIVEDLPPRLDDTS
jgi:hypothetical protein